MASSAGPEPANVRKGVQLAQTHLALHRRFGGGRRPARRCGSRSAVGQEQVRRRGELSGAQAWRDPARQHRPAGMSTHIDPSIAYGTTSWKMEYSTALKLLNFPDARPSWRPHLPEALLVHRLEQREAVHVHHPQGLPVLQRQAGDRSRTTRTRSTARSAASCSRRRSSSSPTLPATNIVGAAAVRAGGAQNASGIRVATTLIINLTKAAPAFLAKLTMPFFQATARRACRGTTRSSTSTTATTCLRRGRTTSRPRAEPVDHDASGTRSTRARGRGTSNGINFTMQVNLEAGFNQVLANQADYQEGIPPAAYAELGAASA